jgi:hypothetical protein
MMDSVTIFENMLTAGITTIAQVGHLNAELRQVNRASYICRMPRGRHLPGSGASHRHLESYVTRLLGLI